MSRRRLPARRPSETRVIEWAAGDGQVADDRVIIVNYFGGDDPTWTGDDGGLDVPGRRLLAVW